MVSLIRQWWVIRKENATDMGLSAKARPVAWGCDSVIRFSGDQGAGFMEYPLAFQADTPPFNALTLLYPLASYVSARLAELPSLGHEQ
jgi:hypothetical protein